ncbi:MAG: M56 family metallopeptidase [Rhodanobacteraceae bacterium]|nr:M56 family metallopeptidase [Rhodanobacteraceae bacterium]
MSPIFLAADLWVLVLLGALAWAAWMQPRWLAAMADLHPEQRARRLMGLALAPWALAWIAVILAFLPTLLVEHGWIGDWCLSRNSGAAQACPMHGVRDADSASGALIALLFMLLAAVMLMRLAWMVQSALRTADRLQLVLRSRMQVDGLPVYFVDGAGSLALALCLPSPRVVISAELRQSLDAHELRALIEHERAHLARRDGYSALVLNIATSLLPPRARDALRAAWQLAVEQSCDRIAAYRAGTLATSSALLKCARLHATQTTRNIPVGVAGFGDGEIAARVRFLLEPPRLRAESGLWSGQWWLLAVPLALILHELGEFVLLPLVR